jgi:hypothetical protein
LGVRGQSARKPYHDKNFGAGKQGKSSGNRGSALGLRARNFTRLARTVTMNVVARRGFTAARRRAFLRHHLFNQVQAEWQAAGWVLNWLRSFLADG